MTSVAVTLADLVAEAATALRDAGIEQPRLEARWLLARVLEVSESHLVAHSDGEIDAASVSAYLDAVRRRAMHEPFAYVVGSRELYGRTFAVDRRVLVPRPETETLIEQALDILRSRHPDAARSPLVIDVGTGSGAIACTLALEAPSATIVACDVSRGALDVAALNRSRLGLRSRPAVVQGHLLTWLRQPADLVVANLPYIRSARIATLMPEVADWEPHLALDGGADGLDLDPNPAGRRTSRRQAGRHDPAGAGPRADGRPNAPCSQAPTAASSTTSPAWTASCVSTCRD